MSVSDLLQRAEKHGIDVELNGDGLHISGNVKKYPDIIAELRANEKTILRYLDGSLDEPPDEHRAEIVVTPDHHVAIDEAITVINREASIYKNDAGLVHIICDEDDTTEDGIQRKHGTPRIRALSSAMLKETMSRRVSFWRLKAVGNKTVQVPTPPPSSIVDGIHQRGVWEGVRKLEGITEVPLLRPNGTIHDQPGYDRVTRKYYRPSVVVPPILDDAKQEDACIMAEYILDLVCDFPFKTLSHRAAWLAGLLSLFARPAYEGPTPLHLMDANVRGCGKSMLTDIIGIITSGRPMARFANPSGDDECRKRILGVALNGDQSVLIDNVGENGLGTPALDAAMTAEVWSDRILGASRIVEAPLRTIWFGSGNNVSLNGDMSRRVCHIRIESDREHPEEREGFKYPDLLGYVHAHRGELIKACLTVLSAFFNEGRPTTVIKPWGSFDGWSNLVRQCVVWATGSDPGETRVALRERADNDASDLAVLLEAWELACDSSHGMTCGEAITKSVERGASGGQLLQPELASAVAEVASVRGAPNSRALASVLRKFEGRVIQGKCFVRAGVFHQATRWKVVGGS